MRSSASRDTSLVADAAALGVLADRVLADFLLELGVREPVGLIAAPDRDAILQPRALARVELAHDQRVLLAPDLLRHLLQEILVLGARALVGLRQHEGGERQHQGDEAHHGAETETAVHLEVASEVGEHEIEADRQRDRDDGDREHHGAVDVAAEVARNHEEARHDQRGVEREHPALRRLVVDERQRSGGPDDREQRAVRLSPSP